MNGTAAVQAARSVAVALVGTGHQTAGYLKVKTAEKPNVYRNFILSMSKYQTAIILSEIVFLLAKILPRQHNPKKHPI